MSASRATQVSTPTVGSTRILADHVEVTWSDGHQSSYNLRWLRHSFLLPVFTKAAEGSEERRVPDVPDLSVPKGTAASSQGGLRIEWQRAGETSEYEAGWLRERCPCAEHRSARRRAPIVWD